VAAGGDGAAALPDRRPTGAGAPARQDDDPPRFRPQRWGDRRRAGRVREGGVRGGAL